MVHERTSGGAGLRPAVPPRPPASSPAPDPASDPAPERVPDRAVEPVLEPAADPAPEPPVPADEAPLDPRAIAPTSLAADRNASLWWVCGGIAVAVAVSLLVGTRAGSLVLSAVVAACGVVRWVKQPPVPVALSVRARWIDVTVLLTFAVGLAVLSQLLPGGWG